MSFYSLSSINIESYVLLNNNVSAIVHDRGPHCAQWLSSDAHRYYGHTYYEHLDINICTLKYRLVLFVFYSWI